MDNNNNLNRLLSLEEHNPLNLLHCSGDNSNNSNQHKAKLLYLEVRHLKEDSLDNSNLRLKLNQEEGFLDNNHNNNNLQVLYLEDNQLLHNREAVDSLEVLVNNKLNQPEQDYLEHSLQQDNQELNPLEDYLEEVHNSNLDKHHYSAEQNLLRHHYSEVLNLVNNRHNLHHSLEELPNQLQEVYLDNNNKLNKQDCLELKHLNKLRYSDSNKNLLNHHCLDKLQLSHKQAFLELNLNKHNPYSDNP